ncbi:hypothetical protein BGW36DRAFT_364465 [Talaromyces proteolyticus]|uniref:DUF7580 domain-containing protein n=1 Tax=Talaromyces proteolyticus TaxID=1131652 RepID=A0AAD4KLM4_9EURO|nr:uncharacterized protein BGW36DRAFT_364465 [Talaromyces proteolyticus]KAH8690916.1 hypothetical protein BGW36DRAFT_364465 [Talaromyces proteolyticus]
MVTGVETAGLVLGSIPLILSGLEFYANGIAVTKRYWRYREEFRSLIIELRTEHTMFVNSINMLLIGVVKQKEMEEFLADPCGEHWKEKKFDLKLQQRLGTSYESYVDTITQLNSTTDVFKQRLKLDAFGKPQFTAETAFKEHYKRLKFSLNKANYSDLMNKLRQANSSLHRMTTQTMSLETLQASCKPDRRAIPKFHVVNDRAHGFYSALRSGWKCSCHVDHTVSLRLEPRMDDIPSDDDDESEEGYMRDPFHVVFRYGHHPPKGPNSPTPTTQPWNWEEADVQITIKNQSSMASYSKDCRKVRFANQAKKAVKAALDPNPNLQPIQDLCAAISTLQKPQGDVCFSLLASEYAKQKYGILIYPLKEPRSDTESWSISSLRSVLEEPESRFARRDRLQLAITLASSVLQLHETPWLDEDWGNDNIFFIRTLDKTIYDHPFVSRHFNLTNVPSSKTFPASMGRIIRNRTLYALGISLIELWYGKPLPELYKPEDGPQGTGDPRIDLMTGWNTADRLVDELYSEAGGKYSDAVRRCIRCDFDRRSSSLEDAAFQRDVYQGVVAQLQENFDFLY